MFGEKRPENVESPTETNAFLPGTLFITNICFYAVNPICPQRTGVQEHLVVQLGEAKPQRWR
jgi:hypothetical protein